MEIMMTDGGPHAPAKWADVTARRIIEIGTESPGAVLAEAAQFQKAITAILTPLHEQVQSQERAALTADLYRGHTVPDPSHHVSAAVAAIIDAAAGTSFAGHFARPSVQAYLRALLSSHFATAMAIERMLHAEAQGAGTSRAGPPNPPIEA